MKGVRVFGLVIGSVSAGAFVFSDFVLERGCGLFLSSRNRSLAQDDPRLEISGIHTNLLFASRPSVELKRVKVDMPSFAAAETRSLKIEFASRQQLFRLLFPSGGNVVRVVDLVRAEAVEVRLSQNVLLSLVASGAAAGVSATEAVVGSVVQVGAAATQLLIGKTEQAENKIPTTNSVVAIQMMEVDDVTVRVLVGNVELPTMLRVPKVRIPRLQPSIESAAELTVGLVGILVMTVVSSSASTLGNVLSWAGNAAKSTIKN